MDFDHENYSIWFREYLYPDELRMTFMSSNLVGGMMQRLDKLRKYAFGSMGVFGSNNNSSISGVWCWRGQNLAFEQSEDLQIDYSSYKWTKLDSKSEDCKKRLRTTSGSRDQTAQDANSATERSSSKTKSFLVSIFYSFLLTSLSNNGKETNTK